MCAHGRQYKSLLAVKRNQESGVQGRAVVELEMASNGIADGIRSWAMDRRGKRPL